MATLPPAGPGGNGPDSPRQQSLDEFLSAEGEDPLVTLDQIAALVHKSKRTLDRYVRDPSKSMPLPLVQGGGGRASRWRWSAIRPWLVATFHLPHLPERFYHMR